MVQPFLYFRRDYMKAWERKRLEYRPKIGHESKILSFITSRQNQYNPSGLINRALLYTGMDGINELMGSLSEADGIKNEMKKKMMHDPSFQRYDDAKTDLDRDRLYENHLRSPKGSKEMDVYPLLENLTDEMEQYIDFMNKALFDGEVDYNDPEEMRRKEQVTLDEMISREYKKEPFNKEKLNSRVQVIAAMQKRNEFYKNSLDQINEYMKTDYNSHFKGSKEGAVRHLTSIPQQEMAKVKDVFEMGFHREVEQTIQSKRNMARATPREMREFMDKQMIDVRNKMHNLADPLRQHTMGIEEEDNIGASHSKLLIEDNINEIANGFTYLVAENVSLSVQNIMQMDQFMEDLHKKRRQQDVLDLTEKIADEFDYTQGDQEVARFIDTHKI